MNPALAAPPDAADAVTSDADPAADLASGADDPAGEWHRPELDDRGVPVGLPRELPPEPENPRVGRMLLDRFLWLIAENVDEEAALDFLFTPAEAARQRELEGRKEDGTLTQLESAELRSMNGAGFFCSLLKATVIRKRMGWRGPKR